jgi:hypothetical protein
VACSAPDQRSGGGVDVGGGWGNVDVVGGAAGWGGTVALSDGCCGTGRRGVGGVSVARSVGGVIVGRGAVVIAAALQRGNTVGVHIPPFCRQHHSKSSSHCSSVRLPSRYARSAHLAQCSNASLTSSSVGAPPAVAGSPSALPPSTADAARTTAGSSNRRCAGIVRFMCRPFAGLAWRARPRVNGNRTLRRCSCHDAGVDSASPHGATASIHCGPPPTNASCP